MIPFHKTSLRLAGLYLAIIMVISVFFSATLYQISLTEVERGLRKPLPVFSGGPVIMNQFRDEIVRQRVDVYEEAKDALIAKLVVTNIIIMVAGGALSYLLAVRTLKPIEDAHAAQSAFAANASHELRTPITAMRSENEVALMDPNLTLAEAKSQLQSNIEELEKLTTLSEGLLQLAQSEGAQIISEETALQQVVQNAIDRYSPTAASRNVVLSFKKSKQKAVVNRAAVTEIIATLVDNAIKFSPDNSIVNIAIEDTFDKAIISVSDRGPGIHAETQQHIFDRFYRAESSRTKQSTSGYGLGLAIAKSLADANGYLLSVSSLEGKGSTFSLSIPKA